MTKEISFKIHIINLPEYNCEESFSLSKRKYWEKHIGHVQFGFQIFVWISITVQKSAYRFIMILHYFIAIIWVQVKCHVKRIWSQSQSKKIKAPSLKDFYWATTAFSKMTLNIKHSQFVFWKFKKVFILKI